MASEAVAKIAVLTGATGSIGGAIARGLAKAGYRTVIASRNLERGTALAEAIAKDTGGEVTVEQCDLSSKESIRAFTEATCKKFPVVDVLVNNAAVVPDAQKETADGVELQFGVNVLAYYMVTDGLMPSLKAAKEGRVVMVASGLAGGLDITDLDWKKRAYDVQEVYKSTKQADRMLAAAAAKHYAGVAINSCHPGVVTSSLSGTLATSMGLPDDFAFDSADEGAATPLFMATDESIAGVTGKYFVNRAVKACPFSEDEAACEALFEKCVELAA